MLTWVVILFLYVFRQYLMCIFPERLVASDIYQQFLIPIVVYTILTHCLFKFPPLNFSSCFCSLIFPFFGFHDFWRSILFINHKEKIEPWTRGSRTYALTGRDFVHKHFICNLFLKKKNSNRKYTNKVLFFLFISEIEFKNICMVIHLVHFIIVWISKFWISFCFLKDK